MNVYDFISLGAMLIMTFLILIQTRGATLGAGLGSSGEINTVRRGSDKTIYLLTLFTAFIFVASLTVGVIL